MQLQPPGLLTVDEAARALGVSPRTVRRWLQAGQLPGWKVGTTWAVDALPARREEGATGAASRQTLAPRALMARLRQVGARLITVGNQVAGATPRRGSVFLAWRRPRGLQITLAIGRTHPTRGWTPHTLGVELPFWMRERPRWRPVLPLLRQYERLRMWCHPRLLRIPEVGAVVQDELTRLDTILGSLAQEAPVPPLGREAHLASHAHPTEARHGRDHSAVAGT
jgi:excisionase family DNA binding protein